MYFIDANLIHRTVDARDTYLTATALLPAVDMKPYKMKAVQKNFNTEKS